MAQDKDSKKPGQPNQAPSGKDAAPKAKADKGGKPKGHHGDDVAEVPAGPRVEPRLQTLYKTQVRAALAEKFGLKNPMQHPRLEKVVVNVNMGRHLENNKLPPLVKTTVLETIQKVTGQKPVVQKAKKSVSNFKVREGAETSAMVTLRRDRMWHFLDRFINLACPRIKDFRGLKDNAFDKNGNYAVGLQEQGVFPEINMAEVNFTHGMNINFCFSDSKPEISRFILAQLGMPFRKDEKGASKGK
ncbi:MAG: 50S ribosomal protein L5 [Phycisphaerae bacterium]|nr:50S ribosomal protein L5 [Phycisphaerae bacterium]